MDYQQALGFYVVFVGAWLAHPEVAWPQPGRCMLDGEDGDRFPDFVPGMLTGFLQILVRIVDLSGDAVRILHGSTPLTL